MSSPSRGAPAADGISLLRRLDNFSGLRSALHSIAGAKNEWAGIPMPLDDSRLVIEPTYPRAVELEAICGRMLPGSENPELQAKLAEGRVKIRNVFYSHRRRIDVTIYEEDGSIRWGWTPALHGVSHLLKTLGASVAWGLEQERYALDLLGSLIRHHAFKSYLLTGMFLESSQRSGLTYLFRKLRPTVVIDNRGDEPLVRCALCLHPIGYYEQSWAGAMTPTDDVVAHLMLMRGDEVMFWKRANQIAPHRPEAGL